MSVKTIAKPNSSAVLITFLSLIEPPGWIMAFTPWSASSWTPSEKGKKASDAATESNNFSETNSCALLAAILQLSNLLGCPDPNPIVDLPFTNTIALDFENLQILNANLRLLSWFIVGFFFCNYF